MLFSNSDENHTENPVPLFYNCVKSMEYYYILLVITIMWKSWCCWHSQSCYFTPSSTHIDTYTQYIYTIYTYILIQRHDEFTCAPFPIWHISYGAHQPTKCYFVWKTLKWLWNSTPTIYTYNIVWLCECECMCLSCLCLNT